jgi:5'(3')-deoxyribonucleotidase
MKSSSKHKANNSWDKETKAARSSYNYQAVPYWNKYIKNSSKKILKRKELKLQQLKNKTQNEKDKIHEINHQFQHLKHVRRTQ